MPVTKHANHIGVYNFVFLSYTILTWLSFIICYFQVLSTRLPVTVIYVAPEDPAEAAEYPIKDGEHITIYGAHAFNVIYVSPDDANNNGPEYIRVIPDFVPLQVRPKRPDLPGTATITRRASKSDFQPPDMKVMKLRDVDFEKVFNKMEACKADYTYVDAIPKHQHPAQRSLPTPSPHEKPYDEVGIRRRNRPPAPLPDDPTTRSRQNSERSPPCSSPTSPSSFASPFHAMVGVPEESPSPSGDQKSRSPFKRLKYYVTRVYSTLVCFFFFLFFVFFFIRLFKKKLSRVFFGSERNMEFQNKTEKLAGIQIEFMLKLNLEHFIGKVGKI